MRSSHTIMKAKSAAMMTCTAVCGAMKAIIEVRKSF
jgi:hypothetical protein